MRGKVLAFDRGAGEGHISGDDGRRYRFAAAEWRPQRAPAAGTTVDFEPQDGEALAVYTLTGPLVPGEKSRIGAALLAIFLGGLGIHKFYLNKHGAGLIMLLISASGLLAGGIPIAVMWLVAVIEAVRYLTIGDEAFEARYVQGHRAWF